jgi:predicted GTPase
MSIVKYHAPNAPYHIAILGRSGVGKSSFCNAIRDRCCEQIDAAPVGVIETTLVPTCYTLMDNVFIWDVPGVSTPNISKDDYCDLINITRYDMFLILSRSRFTEIDLWLSDMVQNRFSKPRFFLRTGIDEELRNYRRDNPANFHAKHVLDMIRENSLKNLQLNSSSTRLSIYLVNAKDKTKYDFPELIDDMMKYICDERDNRVLTVIKDDSQQNVIASRTPIEIAQTIVTTWARFGLISYLYDRYRK